MEIHFLEREIVPLTAAFPNENARTSEAEARFFATGAVRDRVIGAQDHHQRGQDSARRELRRSAVTMLALSPLSQLEERGPCPSFSLPLLARPLVDVEQRRGALLLFPLLAFILHLPVVVILSEGDCRCRAPCRVSTSEVHHRKYTRALRRPWLTRRSP